MFEIEYSDLLFEITSEIDFKTVRELIHVQEGGRVWEQEKRCSINASHICFEIQRKKFEKLEEIAQEVQFKAYSFFIGEKGDNFSLRGIMYLYDNFI